MKNNVWEMWQNIVFHSVCHWKILMKGADGTPYEGGTIIMLIQGLYWISFIGVFLLLAKFPDNYPYKPPEIRFVTPVSTYIALLTYCFKFTWLQIYHCNINSMGRICHPILGRNYIPSMSMREIFDHIYGLQMAPEPDDPLDRFASS